MFRAMAFFLAGLGILNGTASAETPPKPAADRFVVGYLERVVIYPHDFLVYAKMDTGARTASINAKDIEYFSKDGKAMVRFSVTNRDNRTVVFSEPIIRHARIRDIGHRAQVRPVILLGLCVGSVYRVTEVNLSDRKGFNFQLLVGRQFMRQRIIVDPARTYTTEPNCPGAPRKAP